MRNILVRGTVAAASEVIKGDGTTDDRQILHILDEAEGSVYEVTVWGALCGTPALKQGKNVMLSCQTRVHQKTGANYTNVRQILHT